MADRYATLARSPLGRAITGPLGLPRPVNLERHREGAPVINGEVLLGAARGGQLTGTIADVLDAAGVKVTDTAETRLKGLVFDATGIADSSELAELHRFLHFTVGRLETCGRVIVMGAAPEGHSDARARTAQRAIEGLTRSLAKELGPRGITVQLVYLAAGAEDQLTCTLRFLLSPRSAYITGQVIRIAPAPPAAEIDWERPLHRKLALVTGAARGIGAAIAATLARDGARVVGVDVPQAEDELQRSMRALRGQALTLDITQADAPELIASKLTPGVDIVVHNAGVTRDRTIAKMGAERWDELIEINLSSQERINATLLERKILGANARVICISSMSGIAGNAGQTNYAASKAGVIGMVEALAPQLAGQHATINAVAPGFIETAMTAAMPVTIREAGRRMNSLRQGGLPVDVAETVAWLASPVAGGINGSTIRVCGQSLIGA
jgi:3-oxoacyl-[acyl-carrier protein] reductase